MVFLLLLFNKRKPHLDRPALLIGVGIIAGTIFLVRYNNFLFAVLWPLVLVWDGPAAWQRKHFWKRIQVVGLTAAAVICAFKVIPDYLNHHIGYPLDRFTEVNALSFYFQRLWHILYGPDWGLVYTAPFLLIGLVFLCFSSHVELRKKFFVCSLPLLVNLYGVIMYKTQGCSYGYRYIVPAAIPLFIYPFAVFLQKILGKYSRKALILLALVAVPPFLSMVCYGGGGCVSSSDY